MRNKPKEYLVIGCGTKDYKGISGHSSHEYLHYNKSHQLLHPKDQYDTLDISEKISPTYTVDLSSKDQDQKVLLPEKQYQFIVLERFPAKFFQSKTASYINHLLKQDGIVAWLSFHAGFSESFAGYIQYMKDEGFQTAIVSSSFSVFLFSKGDKQAFVSNLQEALKRNGYLQLLFQKKAPKALLEYEYISKFDIVNRIYNISDIISHPLFLEISQEKHIPGKMGKVEKLLDKLTHKNEDGIDLVAFKEAYNATWNATFFKNPRSSMHRKLDKLKELSEVNEYIENNPGSRSDKIRDELVFGK